MGEDEDKFKYGDWAIVKPLKENMQNVVAEIRVVGRCGLATQDVLDAISGQIVRVMDRDVNDMYEVSRAEKVRLGAKCLTPIDTVEAHEILEQRDIKVGDIIEGKRLSDLFYNISNSEMKKGLVWDISGSQLKILVIENTHYAGYLSTQAIANVYGDIAAAYNTFNVIGHTDLLGYKVHCRYMPPKFKNDKYRLFGSLGYFLDNFSVTLNAVRKKIGYCPIQKLIDTGDFDEFEKTINDNTSLCIQVVR